MKTSELITMKRAILDSVPENYLRQNKSNVHDLNIKVKVRSKSNK